MMPRIKLLFIAFASPVDKSGCAARPMSGGLHAPGSRGCRTRAQSIFQSSPKVRPVLTSHTQQQCWCIPSGAPGHLSGQAAPVTPNHVLEFGVGNREQPLG